VIRDPERQAQSFTLAASDHRDHSMRSLCFYVFTPFIDRCYF